MSVLVVAVCAALVADVRVVSAELTEVHDVSVALRIVHVDIVDALFDTDVFAVIINHHGVKPVVSCAGSVALAVYPSDVAELIIAPSDAAGLFMDVRIASAALL